MPVEGRGPCSSRMRDVVKEGRLSDLGTPESVRKLQTALHAKAKAEPEFRFCEGFRMTAHRDDAAGTGAVVRKPLGKEPAGSADAETLWGFDRGDRGGGQRSGSRRS